jgi:CheY-like chemotaxis protein
MVDEPLERVEDWRAALESGGYRIATSATGDRATTRRIAIAADVIILWAPTPECGAWEFLEHVRSAGSGLFDVPVVVVVSPGALEDGLRGAIEGAVRCVAEPIAPDALVAALDAVLAPDAPPPHEQRRASRQRALEVLARIRGWCT